jgi:hypothetical protein
MVLAHDSRFVDIAEVIGGGDLSSVNADDERFEKTDVPSRCV